MTVSSLVFPAVAAILIAMVHAVPAAAEIVIREKTKYYQIQGRSGLDVSKAMLSGGARSINLRHAIAATTTRFRVSDADVGVKNGRCIVNDVKVTLEIEYLYPKWAGKPRASATVRKAWDRFYAELVKHEKTHGRNAREYASVLERELKRVTGTVAIGCRDFPLKADRRFDQVTAQLKRKQAAFDASENRDSSRISQLQIALLKAK